MMITRSQTNKTVSSAKTADTPCSKKSTYNTRSSTVKNATTEVVVAMKEKEKETVKKPVAHSAKMVKPSSIIQTRSQSKMNTEQTQTLAVKIDFDEASRYWTRNKKRLGNGMYAYK